jgi:hypothetical protein
MYPITTGEHTAFKIPYLRYRGVPTGIDIQKVVDTGITPILDIGAAGKDGSQIGAGIMIVPLAPFQEAALAYKERYH